MVLPTLARQLGMQDTGGQALRERLQQYLHTRTMLLVLDNFEHVLAAAAELPLLLAAAPHIAMLVTSRVPLLLRWERTVRISPLRLPDLDRLPPLEEFVQVPSVALFVERAQAQRADFHLTREIGPLVARLVSQLDGLPLAIELAAAHTSVLPLATIARHLEDRLQLLQWEAGDLPERQRSLEAAIAWSYDLLSETEQRLFRHLGVFVGRVSLDAIVAVLREDDEDAVLAAMVSLAQRSLILPGQSDAEADVQISFGMLETVRKYACELLEAAGELESARDAHARYFLGVAERADPELIGPEQRLWFGRLEWTQENLRAALRRLLDHDEERALRMAAALGYFWEARGHMAEGRRWLEEALARAPHADLALRAKALNRLGVLLMWTAGDQEASPPGTLGVRSPVTDIEQAKAVLTEGLELALSVHDLLTIARSHSSLAVLGLFTREWDESRRHLEEARTYWEQAQHAWGVASYHFCLGVLEVTQGNPERATRLLKRGIALYGESGDESARGRALSWLADALEAQGDLSGAVRVLEDLLALAEEASDPRLLLLAASGAIWVCRRQGQAAQLARLLGAAETLRRTTGIAYTVSYRTRVELATEALRTQLGLEELEAAVAEGQIITFQNMAALIHEVLAPRAQSGLPAGQGPSPRKAVQEPKVSTLLSPREQEVLRLVAEGMTSKQIGQQLFLSPRTVDHHLTAIFNKLGVENRAQAVALATRDHLL